MKIYCLKSANDCQNSDSNMKVKYNSIMWEEVSREFDQSKRPTTDGDSPWGRLHLTFKHILTGKIGRMKVVTRLRSIELPLDKL